MDQLRHDVGQLLWIGFEGTQLDSETRRTFETGMAGAAILFARNIAKSDSGADIDAVVSLNRSIHEARPANAPVWVAVDQEGGKVQRVRAPATVWPAMIHLDKIPDATALASQVGTALGSELAAMEFDVDFAPILDVNTNPKNPIIGDRAFGAAPDTVAERALAFASGLSAAGIVGCGKHFPGHGDTDVDSHLALPRVDHELHRLETVELEPFRLAARAGIPLLMTAHVVFAAVDDQLPASLSPKVVGDILRRKLGYKGLVVSDDLDMKAIADHFGIGEAAVMAIDAGCDVLLLCRNVEHQNLAREALIHAAETSADVRARIAESAARVRAAKAAHKPVSTSRDVIGCAAHQQLAGRMSAVGNA